MELSRQNTLVLLCTNIKQTAAANEEISCLIQNDPDWHKVVTYAKSQGVASLVYYNLSRLPCKQAVPSDILFELKKQYLDTAGRNVVVFDELKKLLTLFSRQGLKLLY